MLLGKRQRPPIKRTTSMTEITVDLTDIAEAEGGEKPKLFDLNNPFAGLDQRFSTAATVSPRPRTHRRNSSDLVESAPFLKACSFCKRRLIHGRDIYMYRGDSAFCSPECRQHQMNKDERKEKKCSLVTKKEASTIVTGSEVSTIAETLAAV